MNLYPHQQQFIDDNPKSAILCYETGCGKSHIAKVWLSMGRDANAVVICPKKITKDWSGKWATYSFEQFKKADKLGELRTGVAVSSKMSACGFCMM